MIDDLLPVDFEPKQESIIKVIGVGGGGGNAVNYMLKDGIAGVDFVICNTDSQALTNSNVPIKVPLGKSLTEGRGAGNKPEIGRQSAIESLDDIKKVLNEKVKMVFVTAGMGGGTGTGAAPIIAEAAKKQGMLTVGIVTIPFSFEGERRINQALKGISELEKHVDALLIINNEKLRQMYGNLTLSEAFSKADDVLSIAARSIAEIITVHGYVNVDFADVETVMRNSGVAVMGSAMAKGENRAIKAVEEALNSPLLNSNNIRGTNKILLNIISGNEEVTMQEITQITDYVHNIVGNEVNIIWGNGNNDKLDNQINVTIIATGFSENPINKLQPESKKHQKEETPNLELIIENTAKVEQKAQEKKQKKTGKKIQKPSEDVEFEVEKDDKKPQKKSSVDTWFKEKFTQIFDNSDTSM